jgi:hypothetical protein
MTNYGYEGVYPNDPIQWWEVLTMGHRRTEPNIYVEGTCTTFTFIATPHLQIL